MFRYFKKPLFFTATVALLFSSINAVSAANVSTENVNKSDDEPLSAIKSFLSSLNNGDYSDSINYWIEVKSEEYSSFIEDTENADTGLLSIKKAKLIDSKELDYNSAEAYTPYFNSIISQYSDVHFYYLAVDYKVSKEDEMNMDGVNYVIATVVPEDGEWKIAQYSVAPVVNIVSDKNGFNTTDESTWVKQYKERYKGKYLNRNGQVVKENKPDNVELEKEKAVVNNDLTSTEINQISSIDGVTLAAVDPLTRPSSIKVKLMRYANWYTKYGCSAIGCVKDVPFYYYIKNVLPNEWSANSPLESMKSGAMAVKMYAWYAVYNPLDPMGNYALNDGIAPTGSYEDQAFISDTETTSATQAINAVDSIGMANGDNATLFLARYAKGYFNGDFDAHSGELQQEGSRWWAQPTNFTDTNGVVTVRNKSMYWILDYYYNGTTRVPDLVYFVY